METAVYDLTLDMERGIAAGAELLRAGELVAFPTETVYGLGANALSGEAVKKIFAAKGRPSDNPLIVHVCSVEMAREVAYVDERAEKYLAAFSPGPFSAVLKKKDCIPDEVTAGLSTVAVRFPVNKYAAALIAAAGVPIAAPSANASGRPSPTTAAHVLFDMAGRIPAILDGGECGVGVESTVCDLTGEHPVLLRPGAVTLEMLCEIDPLATLHSGLKEGDTPPSPGMKYRHYAPKAALTVVDTGSLMGDAAIINAGLNEACDAGKRTAVLCFAEDVGFFAGRKTLIMGRHTHPEEAAHSLFALLRELDGLGVEVAYARALPETGVGLAVMNRLKKAASGRVIDR